MPPVHGSKLPHGPVAFIRILDGVHDGADVIDERKRLTRVAQPSGPAAHHVRYAGVFSGESRHVGRHDEALPGTKHHLRKT